MSAREIITVFLGQAGVQIGSSVWELLCCEHGVNCDGTPTADSLMFQTLGTSKCSVGSSFFYEGPKGQYIPRAIFVDLEPGCIDEIRTGSYRDLFHPSLLMSSFEDAASIFARGYHSIGNREMPRLLETFRSLMEECDHCNGILMVHAAGGGTGSGFTSLFLDEITQPYARTTKVECVIFPSGRFSPIMVEPYNASLAAHYCMDNIDVTFIWDNDALYNVCCRSLGISQPSFVSTNRILSMIFSSMTANMRFGGYLEGNLNSYQTNLVPYPRIHFPVCSYAPLSSKSHADHDNKSIETITKAVFTKRTQLCNLDIENGRFVSTCLSYRGLVAPAEVYQVINKMKANERIRFVDWCPTGMKVSLCDMSPVVVPQSCLASTNRNVMMMSNTSAIREPIDRLLTKMAHLYSKRAFVHWFVGEGMEEGEFNEAVDNLKALVIDYESCFGQNHEIPSDNKEIIPTDVKLSSAVNPTLRKKSKEHSSQRPASPENEDFDKHADQQVIREGPSLDLEERKLSRDQKVSNDNPAKLPSVKSKKPSQAEQSIKKTSSDNEVEQAIKKASTDGTEEQEIKKTSISLKEKQTIKKASSDGTSEQELKKTSIDGKAEQSTRKTNSDGRREQEIKKKSNSGREQPVKKTSGGGSESLANTASIPKTPEKLPPDVNVNTSQEFQDGKIMTEMEEVEMNRSPEITFNGHTSETPMANKEASGEKTSSFETDTQEDSDDK